MSFEEWYKGTFILAKVRTRNVSTEDIEELLKLAYEQVMTDCNMYIFWSKFRYDERTSSGTASYIPTTTDVHIDSYHIGKTLAVVDECGNKVDGWEYNRDNCCVEFERECTDIYVCRVAIPPMEACDLDILMNIRKAMTDYVAMVLFESTASTKGSSRFELAERAYYNNINDLRASVPDFIWTDNIDQNYTGVIKNGN